MTSEASRVPALAGPGPVFRTSLPMYVIIYNEYAVFTMYNVCSGGGGCTQRAVAAGSSAAYISIPFPAPASTSLAVGDAGVARRHWPWTWGVLPPPGWCLSGLDRRSSHDCQPRLETSGARRTPAHTVGGYLDTGDMHVYRRTAVCLLPGLLILIRGDAMAARRASASAS